MKTFIAYLIALSVTLLVFAGIEAFALDITYSDFTFDFSFFGWAVQILWLLLGIGIGLLCGAEWNDTW